MSTLGDLLPQDAGSSGGAPQQKKIGDMLAETPAASAKGGVIIPGEISVQEDMPKKAETLSDLVALFPDIRDNSSGYKIVVERIHPKVINGIKASGVLGDFQMYHNGNNILDNEGFYSAFGFGQYIIWVEGPSRSSVDPYTGKPKIIRKAEIKHEVPERPMTQNPQQQQFFMPHPANAQVDLERARTEGRLMDKIAERALNSIDAPRPQDPGSGTSGIAAEAMRMASANAQASIDYLSRQNEALREQIASLMERPVQSGASDEIVRTVLTRGNAEVEMMRSNYERQIEAIRGTYESRIDSMRRDFDDQIRRARDEAQMREDRIRSELSQYGSVERKLFEDRFRNEREHMSRQQESSKADYERAIESLRKEHLLALESLKDSRDRDIEVINNNQRMLIESKETEITRLSAENTRLQDKVASLEARVNMPFHEKIQEVQLYSQLIGVGGKGSDDEGEREPQTDWKEKAMELAQTPVGQMILAAGLQKAGMLPPGAMTAPQPPAPRQMGPSHQPPQQKKRHRQQPPPAPVQDPAQVHSQRAAQEAKQAPAPTQNQPVRHQVEFTGPQPLSKEMMQSLMPKLEEGFYGAVSDNPRVDPKVFALDTYKFVNQAAPGMDLIPKFVNWVDGYNFALILDMMSSGQHGWTSKDKVDWVKSVWEELSDLMNNPPASDPVETAPQGQA